MSGTVPPKRFPTWTYVFWFIVIILITCWPIFAFIAAVVMEPMYDCTRGIVSLTCTTGPEGIGSVIDNLGLMVWIFVITGPIAILLLGIWLGVLIIHLMNRAGRANAKTPV
jgi:hypothetical protein